MQLKLEIKDVGYFIGLFFCQIIFSQDNSDYVPPQPDVLVTTLGIIGTSRNQPCYFDNKCQIVPCRKESVPSIFTLQHGKEDKPDPLLKKFEKLDYNDKEYLFKLAATTKEKRYFDAIIKIALTDTFRIDRDQRIASLEYLSVYNSNEAKNILFKLIESKDTELVETAALSLIQLGEYNIGLKTIKKYYKCSKILYDEIHNALMTINTPDAIKLLKEMTDNPDPSYGIDAAAGLSLIGYCDFAFQKFKEFTTIKGIKGKDYDTHNIKKMAAYCLAYYIGTKEAFDVIKKMKNDPEISDDIEMLLKISNIK